MMIYTSGTTGQPKGALHGHRVLLGHLPGVEMPHYPFPAAGRPLLDAGRLGLGRRPARRAAAEPASRRAGGGAPLRQVRSGRSLRADGIGGRAQRLHPADGAAHDARGAEPAAAATTFKLAHASAPAASRSASRRWNGASEAFGLTINEFYGQTECNLVLGSCAQLGVMRARRDRQAGARPHAWR